METAWDFCQRMLVEVSRSFALIIPECPPPIDRGLCVAYLLCRIADTIEDESSLDQPRRNALYDDFLDALDHPGDEARARRFVSRWPEMTFVEPGYAELVAGTRDVLKVYDDLPAEVARPIRTCVGDMVAGMRISRPVETHGGVAFFCCDLADLDRYCQIVAGTVGIMSTALFEWRFNQQGDNLFRPTSDWREAGRRLGLGLQMTNIIKDCRVDAARGVSFIPSSHVAIAAPGSYVIGPQWRGPLFGHAITHLDVGLSYTLAIPRRETGIRRFLLGSLLPAIATLEVAASGTEHHPKIDRSKMVEILELIADEQTSDAAIREWYNQHRQRTMSAAEKHPKD